MAVAVRAPAAAGTFYPDDADTLAAEIDRHLAAATDHGLEPKAVIAPHAGYRYSAPVAASVYKGLARMRARVSRIVLLGPAHRVRVEGIAVPAAEWFASPLGRVGIDSDGRATLAGLPHVVVDDEPHAPEHSLEVHVPFLQRLFPEFTLLPLCVGEATPDEVADVIERTWGGDETLVVVSSDLSHYHDYETARRLDARTTETIERLAVEQLRSDSACGARPVAGLLGVARRRGMNVTTLDVRNSGDTQGDKERVVGYGAWAFVEPPLEPLDAEQGNQLVDLARAAVAFGARGGRPWEADLDVLPDRLRQRQAAFVTLRQSGELRGCIGSVEPTLPLATGVVRAARSAAFDDPRFPPVTSDELTTTDVSVSTLSRLIRMFPLDHDDLITRLRPGFDGLVLVDGAKRGVFLPQVWDQIADPAEFVARLETKAGFDPGHWSPTLAAYTFEARHWG